MLSVFQNYILVSALVGWCIAQIIKIFTGMFRNQKFNLFKLLVSTGGMPSSHSATVSALCTASCIKYSVTSFQFAVTFVFAMIIMRDAAGIRKDVGEQAKVINQIMKSNSSVFFENINLKELVGHTPFQVVIGAIVGISSALLLWPVFK